MPEASKSVIEPSPEFIESVLNYIKAHWPLRISELINAMVSKFPPTYTRNDVKSFVIKALRVLTETGAIDTRFVSSINMEDHLLFPTN